MSKTLSTRLQPSSRAVVELQAPETNLLEACELLASHGFFGMVWLDPDLRSTERYGGLAELVPTGLRVTDTVMALWGLENELLDLINKPNARFEMPNVAIANADGNGPRLNFHVFWLAARQQFLLLIAKVVSTGDLELGLAQQVRARMIVEAELAQKSRALAAVNAELERANRDLAEFAYVISHDLKAPLRAMRYLTNDLDRVVANPGHCDPTLVAGQIHAQSQRMSRMLTDLLAYSKIGRQTDALAMIETGSLIRSIVGSLPRAPAMSIVVNGEWPVIETYAAPLDLILRNIISNALNHHDRTDGRIMITANVSGRALEIEIIDDGPGIAPEWHEAIFQPFRTIASGDASGQSGIGLALVRKAVETTGATLSLTSNPSERRGSAFKLLWPLIIND